MSQGKKSESESRRTTDAFREGYDRIFGKNETDPVFFKYAVVQRTVGKVTFTTKGIVRADGQHE